MNIIEEIKESLKMEIRPNSMGTEYLEAVFERSDLELLQIKLTKHLGPAAKRPGEEATLPREIQEIVDGLGGLRIEQSFFCKRVGTTVFYAALWPWASNPEKITLKSGIVEL